VKKIAVTLIVFTLICGSLGVSKVEAEKVGRITKKLEEMREASLKEVKLSNYQPGSIRKFDRKKSHTADDLTLDVWKAEAGWLTLWKASKKSHEVSYHALRIDTFMFSTEEKARKTIIDEMEFYGQIKVETIQGFPVMEVTWKNEENGEADAFIGYHQGKNIIFIQVFKTVINGTISPNASLREAKRAFRAIAAKGRQ